MNNINISNINYDKLGQIRNKYSLSKVNPYDGTIINFGNTIKLPQNVSQLGHIFDDRTGHIVDNPANRQLLQDISNDKNNYLGPDMSGNSWYGKVNPNGTQTWTVVRGNTIRDGGVNEIPRTYNPKTGLSSIIKPNAKKRSNK